MSKLLVFVDAFGVGREFKRSRRGPAPAVRALGATARAEPCEHGRP